MKGTNYGRRRVLLGTAGLGLAAMLPSAGIGQPSGTAGSLNVPATDIGKYHREILFETTYLLDGQPLFTERAFDVQIDSLVKKEIIRAADAEILKELSKSLLSERAFEEIEEDLRALAEKLKSATNEVAAAIGSIAEDSLLYVKELAGKLDKKKLALVIAHDVQGALTGAATGAALGAIIVGLGATPGAVFGALLGAASGSVIGALGAE
ncbi:hypothetical protein [Pseudomonas sp.]|uniref:hypothetical protein n=1 Tax=Pseudomonas sp. TaxID=306 RepID=UPI00299EC669|nr:hypothetical protein [Pseudomonas sp.]MDX1370351.1 hypothetical protein [Pseudomonas sp.]